MARNVETFSHDLIRFHVVVSHGHNRLDLIKTNDYHVATI